MTSSLFERLGGEATLIAAIERFYRKVLEDELTRPFFAGLDVQAQTTKQLAFMSRAFGGPREYHGRDLRTAHAGLVSRGLGDEHFDAIVAHLAAVLRELGVDESLREEVMNIVMETREEVLGRGSPAADVPFDIVIAQMDGARVELSLEKFLALPLPNRVSLILESTTSFVLRGRALELSRALARLRLWAANPQRVEK